MNADVAIIGAGPVGLFAVFELGLLGLKAVLFDSLEKPGGQCAELYPEKPIYDIPAYPIITGQELTDRLLEQIEPFDPQFRLSTEVKQLEKLDGGRWRVIGNDDSTVEVFAVFIAAGAGSFTPRKPKIQNLIPYENKSLFYAVRNRKDFEGKHIVVAGGGDSALDWTLDLLDSAASLTLVHRRDKFRAAPASVERMRALVDEGRMKFVLGELSGLKGEDGQLSSVSLKQPDGSEIDVLCDRLLALFGLNIKLGPLENWGLDLHDGKQIKVDTEKFETNIPGIFAIGDINWYPGKLKLILSGFHEATLAAHAAFALARPEDKFVFRYTTSSTELHKRLKVS